MSLSGRFSFKEMESKWQRLWEEKKIFKPKKKSKKNAFTIVMPPPNITGKLHLGHILNLSVQDVAIRYHQMKGKAVWWIPGLDHAAIATEAKVVKMLKAKGIEKHTLSREDFLKEAWLWKKKYGSLILEQMKRLGIAVDFSYTPFTLDPIPSAAVKKAFITLYRQGKIYRAKQMIHWDPQAQSALSNEEVIYKEVKGKLYYITYPFVDQAGGITIATTRPETLLGDGAVAVHPEDVRYQAYIGKQLKLPLTDRLIPVIADPYVQQALGSGALKVTPAHDPNDYQLSQKHDLPLISIFTKEGKINKEGGTFQGLTQKEARKAIVEALKTKGYLQKIEPHTHQVGFSERTNVAVEPRISIQWFLKMKALTKPALQAVETGVIQFAPKHLKATYRHWLNHIHDWCISRQLWWGHPIPAYYLPDGSYVVASSPKEALEIAIKENKGRSNLTIDSLEADPDVLDTWFSAWLWPISILNGFKAPQSGLMQQRYPSDLLVTGSDILFFWVARMIIAGYAFLDRPPFKQVYFTGLVRDKQRRKMSKSLGNSPDTFALMDKYGADGVRMAVLLASPAGNDLLFDEQLCMQGAQFVHKLWHATQLLTKAKLKQSEQADLNVALIFEWWDAEFRILSEAVGKDLEKHQYADALMKLYRMIKERFCGHYLEFLKKISKTGWSPKIRQRSASNLYALLKLLHPFLPFITEELASQLTTEAIRSKGLLLKQPWPIEPVKNSDQLLQAEATAAFDLIRQIRHARIAHHCALKQLYWIGNTLPSWLQRWKEWIEQMSGVEQFVRVENASTEQYSFIVHRQRFLLDRLEEKKTGNRLASLQKMLISKERFLTKIEGRLNNPDFLKSAPAALIAKERQKALDTTAHINALKQQLTINKDKTNKSTFS